jgi:hypothetical protein
LPAAALAGEVDQPTGDEGATNVVPDHAQAEARSGTARTIPTAEEVEGAPDHAQAEARGGAGTTVPAPEATPGVPDHAAAESHGVAGGD